MRDEPALLSPFIGRTMLKSAARAFSESVSSAHRRSGPRLAFGAGGPRFMQFLSDVIRYQLESHDGPWRLQFETAKLRYLKLIQLREAAKRDFRNASTARRCGF
ncbi:MAG: hypothetical protein DMG30_17910 [Acidobacteria bacterium]|nr:MAG: hypothetical protein DMG30_17910 [Acidobacteriota bacterium]